MFKFEVPNWITFDDQAPWKCYVDADAAYPVVLEVIGVTGTPDKHDLEIAHRFIQWTAKLAATGRFDRGTRALEIFIKNQQGNKERFAQRNAPVGKAAEFMKDDGELDWRRQLVDAREKWTTITGLAIPS